VHNYFRVSLPLNGMAMENKTTRTISLRMEINNWFCSPHTWDFNYWGGYIMQNQEAMQIASENGKDVFTLSSLK